MTRWLKFNAVGLIGMGVQAAALWSLMNIAGLHYLVSTGLAVEAAILNNFVWHVCWTFADRNLAAGTRSKPASVYGESTALRRALWRFHLSAGSVSIPGNLAIMWLMVEQFRMAPMPANLIAIAVCSTGNFLLADRFSFQHTGAC